jgi:hypothetical protein
LEDSEATFAYLQATRDAKTIQETGDSIEESRTNIRVGKTHYTRVVNCSPEEDCQGFLVPIRGGWCSVLEHRWTGERNGDSVRDDRCVDNVAWVLPLRAFLVQPGDLHIRGNRVNIRGKAVKHAMKPSLAYRVGHGMAKVDTSITEANSCE